MPLIMKLRFRLVMLMLACCTLAQCNTTQPPVTREALVGSYTYESKDPESRATDHDLDHLVLQSDGKYDLVQGGPTKPRTETVGSWTLMAGGADGPEVLLDHSGYPIQMKRNEIRLLIDNDVGIWYAKAK
jgi:hypothetical protein